MSPAAINATITLTNEIESVIDALAELLDRETEAVTSADFATFKVLQNDKMALMTRYRALIETTQKQTENFTTANDTIKERLQSAATRLDKSVGYNKSALEGGTRSMQRIMERVITAAKETLNEGRTTYTKGGRTSGGGTLSISLNEIL